MRSPTASLLESEGYVVACCHRYDGEAIGEGLDDVERVPADGAGRAEDGDAFHAKCFGLPNHHCAAEILAEHGKIEEPTYRHGKQQSVDAIENAPVAR